MPLPTLPDLAAERLWTGTVGSSVVKMVEYLPAHLCEHDGTTLRERYSHEATIKEIALLVLSRYPGQPAPGLDAIWTTKGDKATVQDLRAYWESERLKDAASNMVVDKSPDAAASAFIDPPADNPTPSLSPPRTIKLKNYIPNAAELYGYELWCQKDATSFSEQAHGRPLTLAQSLAPHTKDWTKASLAMIMTLTKLQLPEYPTPSFDHLWKIGFDAKRDALVDLWWRCSRGDVDLEVEENATPVSPPIEARAQELLATLQASPAVAQTQAAPVVVDASFPTLLDIKTQLDKISDSLAIPGSTVSDWTELASSNESSDERAAAGGAQD